MADDFDLEIVIADVKLVGCARFAKDIRAGAQVGCERHAVLVGCQSADRIAVEVNGGRVVRIEQLECCALNGCRAVLCQFNDTNSAADRLVLNRQFNFDDGRVCVFVRKRYVIDRIVGNKTGGRRQFFHRIVA